MDSVDLIALWAGLFIGSHMAISALLRPRLIAAIGPQPYQGLYSLVSFATFIPLIVVFARHKHSGPMLWYLRTDSPVRWIAWLLMLLAFIIVVAGFMTPNPAGIGAPAGVQQPRGVLKLTRHPAFVGLALFGIAHMLMNGWLGDLIFFGTFPALSIIGGLHQDRRKLHEIGESYRKFVAETSFFPGSALLGGRQKWGREDMPWTAIATGTAVTVLLVVVHPWLFGGQPIG